MECLYSSLTLDLEEDPEFSNRAKCEAEITEDGPFRIDDFNYNVSSVGNRIFFHLENTDFRGVTVSSYMHCTFVCLTNLTPTFLTGRRFI